MSAVFCLLWPAGAGAQDKRPTEQEMFGGPPAPPAPAQPAAPARPAPPAQPAAPAPPAPPPPEQPGNVGTEVPAPAPGPVSGPEARPVPPAAAAEGGGSRDQTLLGNPDAATQLSDQVAPENPLVIGGQIYLRGQVNVPAHTAFDQWRLAAPNLIDAYFDARPNDRVRAFIRARVSYDPTAAVAGTMPGGLANPTNGGAFVNPGSIAGFTTTNTGRGPNTVLDQAWIAFDVENAVFVTAGKQHVRWGTGRFWTPTDYLHPLKRNPFDVFDARTGTSMLKVHVPWESKAWNFYGFGVIEDPSAATGTLGAIAGAGRAEMVLGASELGLDFFVKQGQRPRFGADLSFGLGDFDFYTDAGLRFGDDFLVVERTNAGPVFCVGPNGSSTPMDPPVAQQYRAVPSSGFKPQVVAGANWSHKYNDNDVLTLGGEYFYNSVGYKNSSLYPGLIFNQQNIPLFTPLYTGQHYAALFLSLPAPYSWNYTTFTLTTLGNLSDKSFVTRLDYSLTVLTHLTFQAFAAIHYGDIGELRLAFDVTQQVCDPMTGKVTDVALFPPTQPPLVDLGVALLLKI
jgi:hypothetical protein